MNASILTIGDELLIGQVLNSNVQWISERLTETGVQVTRHLSVGDRLDEITAGLRFLQSTSDVLIIGGGLGPTHDDLTIEALSSYFKIPLRYDEEWVGRIETFFRSRGRVMTENNRKQGYLLRDAERIDNDCGTAAGQFFIEGKTRIFVVPGVPHEMKSMTERFIIPKLETELGPSRIRIRKETLLTTGIGESALAERLEPIVQRIRVISGMTLAFLPSNTGVRLRLQMKIEKASDEQTFENALQELREGCGKDAYGTEPGRIEERVFELLLAQGKTVALAESCTGGLVSHRLTSIAGASKVLRGAVIPYQRDLKVSFLGIEESALNTHGVVSAECARLMADQVRVRFGADFGLATTGYLGPEGGDRFAPLGTVFVAVSGPTGCTVREFRFENHRERAKERAGEYALDLLRRSVS
jgi:nicotinamide-nucleotide amidase